MRLINQDICELNLTFLTLTITRSISMVSKPFVFEVFVVESAQAVTLSIIVLMCFTINVRDAWKVTDKPNYFLLVGSKWGCIPKVSFLGCLQVP